MGLTKGTVYGIYGLVYLAVQPEGKFVPLSEVSTTAKLPIKFLAKIFQALVRSGLVRSYRGVRGGFQIARPKEEIVLKEIIESIQGPIRFIGYLNNKIETTKPVNHRLRIVCHQIEDFCQYKLQSTTLADLI